MLQLGFRPVGKQFPVFLHPETQEEYALARTERKVGKGHGGFDFQTGSDVTIPQLSSILINSDFINPKRLD